MLKVIASNNWAMTFNISLLPPILIRFYYVIIVKFKISA